MIRRGLRILEILLKLPHRALSKWKGHRHGKSPWTAGDDRLKEIFLNGFISEQERYSELFSYFVSGFLYYRAPDCAHAYYPGASSKNGADIDAMEGFCRILPLISAWICSGRHTIVKDSNGRNIDLKEVALKGLLAGTDPGSKGFWGHIRNYDQRIVEASDVALSIWLLRDHVWPQLTSPEKEKIVSWLLEVNGKTVHDNNWHLFPLLVNEVLFSLGYPADRKSARAHYERLKSFYSGDGWFSDGQDGPFDYYNAWGIHYGLFWLNLINPELDPAFIDDSLNDFVRGYKYLFSPEGVPITGRSICYRMAAPAPLVAAAARKLDGVGPGMARRALDCVWKYFIAMGAVCYGKVTQGYWQDDMRFLDNYSGAASCLWSVRSLVLAFYCPWDSDFWTASLEQLPVERDDYTVSITEIQWEIRGCKLTKEVKIVKKMNAGNALKKIESHTTFQRVLEYITVFPFRPKNSYSKYRLQAYSSLRPFWDLRPDAKHTEVK